MIKPLIIIFNTVSVFLFSFFFGDAPVTLSGEFPKNVKVATEFTAQIKINKGSIGGFAKLQLEVPQGFTVKELDSKSGAFSYTGTIAKIIWTSMPNEPEFLVKFTLTADASAAGLKTIASKFSYVNNNNKEVAEMTPVEIMVGDAVAETPVAVTPSITAREPVTETKPVTEAAATTSLAEPNSEINCIRTITNGSTPNLFNVEVKIKKGAIKGFAKFQEVLPTGYTAKGDKTNGASFSLSDGKLKFVWASLPADEDLTISYVLEKTDAAAADAKLDNGEFSYLENDQSKKTKLQIDQLGKQTEVVATPITEPTPTVAPEPVAVTPTTTEPTKTEVSPEPTKTEVMPAESKEAVIKKEGNVQYAVQVGAFKNAIESSVLSNKFNVTEKITSEMADGFSKFMVGNFNEYKRARSHREVMKYKGCRTAFVVAYNGPKRITVQEALMITNQKWFK
jgi:cell division protein FtsN